MPFEAGVALALVVAGAAFVVDWPRALAGVIFGIVGRYFPYATIFVPLGAVVIAALGELVYPLIGRTAEPSLHSFATGVFAVGATACSLYVTIRNLRDRL